MPLYTYECSTCEHTDTDFRTIDARDEPGTCGKCGSGTARIFDPGHTRGVIQEFATPIEMLSVAVDNDHQIREFQQRNPDIEISRAKGDPRYGVPIARTRQQKLSVLRNEGFTELN